MFMTKTLKVFDKYLEGFRAKIPKVFTISKT